MSGVRTIFANMSWMVISQVLSSVCAFVWTIITARYLGVYNNGILGTAISFTTILSVFLDLGLTTYIVRAISTDFENEPKYLGVCITTKAILYASYFFLTLIIPLILGWDHYLLAICLLFAIENIIMSTTFLFNVSFQAHEKMHYQAISTIIISIANLLFIVFVSFTDWNLWGISFAYIIANLLGCLYSIYAVLRNIVVPKLTFDFEFSKTLIKASIPFALTTLFYTIYYSIDMVMLTQFSSAYQTGLYNATYKLVTVLTLFYSIYTAVVFPVMSKLFKNEVELLNLSFVKSVKYLSMVTIPICIFVLFYAGDMIMFCYGNQYASADNVLKILIWTVSFLFINGACSLVLNASHNEVSVTKIYCVAALFNVVLNFVLIPYYSVYGASFATVLSEILILVLMLVMLSRIGQLPDGHLLFDMGKIVFASVILGVFLYYVPLSMWIAIPVAVVFYLVVLLVVRILDDDDKVIVRQILNR